MAMVTSDMGVLNGVLDRVGHGFQGVRGFGLGGLGCWLLVRSGGV